MISTTYLITPTELKTIVPTMKEPDEWSTALNEILPKYNITSRDRIAAFVAQCAHESMGFNRITENLNYSANGLRTTFGKYFPTLAIANQYARKPEKIANRAYASRMGNGNESSGDGWKYRGRGTIQLTGKTNYQAFATSINKSLDETIDYLGTKEGAVESACWFWKTNDLNRYADTKNIVALTKKINGGTTGLQSRIEFYDRALSAIPKTPIVVASSTPESPTS